MALEVTKMPGTVLEEGREAYFRERSSPRNHREVSTSGCRELPTGSGETCVFLSTASLGKIPAENPFGKEAVEVLPCHAKSDAFHPKGKGYRGRQGSARVPCLGMCFQNVILAALVYWKGRQLWKICEVF